MPAACLCVWGLVLAFYVADDAARAARRRRTRRLRIRGGVGIVGRYNADGDEDDDDDDDGDAATLPAEVHCSVMCAAE